MKNVGTAFVNLYQKFMELQQCFFKLKLVLVFPV